MSNFKDLVKINNLKEYVKKYGEYLVSFNENQRYVIKDKIMGFVDSYNKYLESKSKKQEEIKTKQIKNRYEFFLNSLFEIIENTTSNQIMDTDECSNDNDKIKFENIATTIFPFFEDFKLIREYLIKSSESFQRTSEFNQIITEITEFLQIFDNIFPLLVLREHVNFILSEHGKGDKYDENFYEYLKNLGFYKKNNTSKKPDILILSKYIQYYIPYSIRDNEGFKEFKYWDTLAGLYLGLESINQQIYAKIPEILENFGNYLDSLILFQIDSKHKIFMVEKNIFDMFELVKVKPASAIVEHYVEIFDINFEDDIFTRLAILRVITAIGEACIKIHILIKDNQQKKILNYFIKLRDFILHSTTYETSKFINDLFKNKSNKKLISVLNEIKKSKTFIIDAINSSIPSYHKPNPITVPEIHNVEMLLKDFEEVKKTDNSNEKFTLEDYNVINFKLNDSIPIEDKITNPKFEEIEKLIRQENKLEKKAYQNICLIYKKDDYENLIELRKIYKKSIQNNLSEKEKKEIEKIIDEKRNKFQYIDTKSHKKTLSDFIDVLKKKKYTIPEKMAFENSLKIVFHNDEYNYKLWNDFYKKYNNQDYSIKNDIKRQFEFLFQNFLFIHEIVSFANSKNSSTIFSLAIEMLYGLYSNSFKSIIRNKKKNGEILFDLLYDYTDETLYLFGEDHPINKIKNYFNQIILLRNRIFHFNEIFERYRNHVSIARGLWNGTINNQITKIPSPLIQIKNFIDLLEFNIEKDCLNIQELIIEKDFLVLKNKFKNKINPEYILKATNKEELIKMLNHPFKADSHYLILLNLYNNSFEASYNRWVRLFIDIKSSIFSIVYIDPIKQPIDDTIKEIIQLETKVEPKDFNQLSIEEFCFLFEKFMNISGIN